MKERETMNRKARDAFYDRLARIETIASRGLKSKCNISPIKTKSETNRNRNDVRSRTASPASRNSLTRAQSAWSTVTNNKAVNSNQPQYQIDRSERLSKRSNSTGRLKPKNRPQSEAIDNIFDRLSKHHTFTSSRLRAKPKPLNTTNINSSFRTLGARLNKKKVSKVDNLHSVIDRQKAFSKNTRPSSRNGRESQKDRDMFYDQLSNRETVASNGLKSKTNTSTKSLQEPKPSNLRNVRCLSRGSSKIGRKNSGISIKTTNSMFDEANNSACGTLPTDLSSNSSGGTRTNIVEFEREVLTSPDCKSYRSDGSKSFRSVRRRKGITAKINSKALLNSLMSTNLLRCASDTDLQGQGRDLSKSQMTQESKELRSLVTNQRVLDWMSSFCLLDPRNQILKFFDDVAREGVRNIEVHNRSIRQEGTVSPHLRYFCRCSAFSVWRPTSNDAIKKMMTGEATGKGLDVKGKSAKKGKLSGFIPFLQIHDEKHKKDVRWPPKDGSIRIYYKSEAARNQAVLKLTAISNEMETAVADAKSTISIAITDEARRETALQNLKYELADPKVHLMDDYCPLHYGIRVAERVFFEAYISREDITRSPEYITGRPSEPAFQDMNFTCIRKFKGRGPRPVVIQLSETVNDSLSSQSLVVAYEENGRVTPVASDFDGFLVGTRGVKYETSLSKDQVEMMRWLLTQIESILESPSASKSWTSRWLEVLKESAAKGFHPKMPEYGYGDPKSYAIMKNVVGRLKSNGAVRHGAECFNYGFPQELDNEFLVICERLEGKVPWKYVNVKELQEILMCRIDMGFTFPLNLKWILADHGWKAVYDKMISSKNESIRQSLAVWYPSDIRELIEDIYKRFPDGFYGNEDVKTESTEAMDLANQQLKSHIIVQRAKFKLKIIFTLMKIGNIGS